MSKKPRSKKHRSPAYPFIGLNAAISRARELYEKQSMHPGRIPTVAGHWGFRPKSSGGLQTVAALKQFGLVEDAGRSGKDRQVQLTDMARQVLLRPEASPERVEAIRRAALSPPLYAEMSSKWGEAIPSDENVATYLTLDRNFNPAAVPSIIKNYKDTLVLAGAHGSGNVSDNEAHADDEASGDSFGSTDMNTTAGSLVSAKNPTSQARPGVRQFSWPLAKGVIAEVRLSGGEVKSAHLEMLRQYLELAKTAIDSDDEG